MARAEVGVSPETGLEFRRAGFQESPRRISPSGRKDMLRQPLAVLNSRALGLVPELPEPATDRHGGPGITARRARIHALLSSSPSR